MDRQAVAGWEVQTRTLGGWENVWNEDGKPMTFLSRGEAQAELRDHLREVKDAVRRGDMDEEYSPDDYRIVPVRRALAMDNAKMARELLAMAKRIAMITPETEKMIDAAMPELERQLKPMLGLMPRFAQVGSDSRSLRYEDEVGASSMGVFDAVFKEVAVTVRVSATPLEDGTYYADVGMRWEHRRGGSNGGDVATAWYDPASGKWKVRPRA